MAGAKETASKISGSEETTIVQTMDVTKVDDWKSAIEAINKKWGKLDAVINNAGWTYKNKVGVSGSLHDIQALLMAQIKRKPQK